VLVQKLLRLFEVSFVWHDDSGLSLNGLDHEGNDVRVLLQCGLEGSQVIVRNSFEARHERAEAAVRGGVRGAGDGRERAAPKVVFGEQDFCLVFGHPSHFVAPLPARHSTRCSARETTTFGNRYCCSCRHGSRYARA
jgi:hypothetical protein